MEPLTREELQAMVDAIPNEQLLRDFARLTHQIASAKAAGQTGRAARLQRGMIEAEILRRMLEGHS